jgi:hypothetical protein
VPYLLRLPFSVLGPNHCDLGVLGGSTLRVSLCLGAFVVRWKCLGLIGLSSRVERRQGVNRGTVDPGPRTAHLDEPGLFEHREEDLPRHGTGNSVGPGRLIRRRFVPRQTHIAGLEPPAGLEDAEDLTESSRFVGNQVEDAIAQGNVE